jgi:chemotaxis protein methyltransferase CheR
MSGFLADEEFEQFRRLIYNESGIHFSSSNRSILEGRLKERVKKAGASSVKSYYEHILQDEDELKSLLDSVTTNLTRFFRNHAHIQTFQYYVIPDLITHKKAQGDKTIRLWSAGCSTGEEPYTIAIVLQECLPPDMTYEIVASDISLKSLMIAKEGFYNDNRITGVPDEYLQKYFDRRSDGYKISPKIKEHITFDYHNLKNDSGLRGLDVVFCRNVLIYFDEAAQKAAVDRFWETMSWHSFLFIGHSESLFGMQTGFQFLKTDWACIYKKDKGKDQ